MNVEGLDERQATAEIQQIGLSPPEILLNDLLSPFLSGAVLTLTARTRPTAEVKDSRRVVRIPTDQPWCLP